MVVLLLVGPFTLTLIGAVRTKRSQWTIALAPPFVLVLTVVELVAYLIFATERPFD